MKKWLALLGMAAVLALAGCGSDKEKTDAAIQNSTNTSGNSSPAEKNSEEAEEKGVSKQVAFGEPIEVVDDNPVAEDLITAKVTISDYELLKDVQKAEWESENYDFIKIKAHIQNTGKVESYDYLLNEDSFDLYDANGRQLDIATVNLNHIEGQFERADLRPGGSNEGFIYLAFKDGAVPAELIYYESSVIKGVFDANEYIFKLQ